MGEPDFYAVLGVRPDASPAEISHAYRDLVRRHHPDRRTDRPPETSSSPDLEPGSEEELDRIVAAYAVLRDAARRADYDKRRLRVVPPPRPRHTPSVPLHVSHRSEPQQPEPPIRVGPVRYHGPPV